MMNKLLLPLYIFLLIACSKESDTNAPSDGYDKVFSLLVVNEGEAIEKDNVGSVCRYSVNNNQYVANIYGGTENVGMGGESVFATIWQDTLYVVSKNNNLGYVLATYNNKTGAFIKGSRTDEGVHGSSFAVINNKTGVLSTNGGGALIIDMATLTKQGTLLGTSTYTGDMIVCQNNLYIIDNQERILIYSLENIATATPRIIEKAVGGFSLGPDGELWAYYNESYYDSENRVVVESPQSWLIKINTLTAQEIERVEISVPILKSFNTYYPGLLSASLSENTLFFIKSAEIQNQTLYKYDIRRGELKNLYTLSGNESFRNIIYNPSNSTIAAIVYTYANTSGKYSIRTIDALSGKLKQSYNTSNPTNAQKRGTFLLLERN